MLSLIVCTDNNNGIGKFNTIPWYIKDDLINFRKITSGLNNVVIMGYKTWLSLPKRPLPNRINVIISREHYQELKDENYNVYLNLNSAISHYRNHDIYIIGGGMIYNNAYELHNKNLIKIDYIYKTIIKHDFNCDIFFPDIPMSIIECSDIKTFMHNDINFNGS